MEALSVGMYVRLKNDVEDVVIINKIANVFENYILTENDGSIYQGVYTKENVIKASYNIIDILEEGDYVNGLKVHCITDYGLEVYMFGDAHEILEENEIETIVTKEMFSSVEYRMKTD